MTTFPPSNVESLGPRVQPFRIFLPRENPLGPAVCQAIAAQVGSDIPLGAVECRNFADGEFWCKLGETVRGQDVFILQSCCSPVNDHYMEIFLMADACRRASARRVTAVIPYYGYARQDRKTKPRVPISAAVVSRLLEASGIDRVVAIDLHCGQIQGFFSSRIPCDNLYARDALIHALFNEVADIKRDNLVCVSPDAGGAERTDGFRQAVSRLYNVEARMSLMSKHREDPNEVETMELIGVSQIRDADCVIVDDLADTCGTLQKAAEILVANGASRVFACVTHGLMNGPAVDRLNASPISLMFITDTVPFVRQAECPKIKISTIAPLLADAMIRIQNRQSVSELFPEYNES